MYKMSHVAYQLSNGMMINTLDEAKESGLSYQVKYIPEYEIDNLDDEVKARRRKLD